jgi:phosphonate transport system permease protein
MMAPVMQKPKKKRIRTWIYILLVVALYTWAFAGIEFGGLKETAWQITKAILNGIINPDWSYVYHPEGEDLIRNLFTTVSIAFLGTFIAAILCIPFTFLAARNIMTYKPASSLGKFLLSVIRTFPELILALLFIKAVGPGSFAGVLAVGIHSIGMLGKLSSEALENMDLGPTEALISSGANRIQTIWFAVVPQVLPEFLNFVLYRFEVNVRAASVLGVVGAGGIGTPLIFALTGRSWDRVGIILLGIIVMVLLIDYLSGAIRKRLV